MNEMAATASVFALSTDHLAGVASIHMRAFPKSALTAVGTDAVRRYYTWQLEGPHDLVAIGSNCEDTLAGFCFGGVFRGALSGFVRANRSFLIRRVLTHPWLAANPLFRDRIFVGVRTLNMSRKKPALTPAPQPADSERSFGILAIAVDPAFQGAGIGKLLLQESEAQAARQGFTRMHLTVQVDNWQAIRFYERMGWEKIADTSPWNGRMTKLLGRS